MQNSFIIFIHFMAAAIAIGSLTYSVLLYLPRVKKTAIKNSTEEKSPAYIALEVLPPTVFVSLLVLIATGIYFLFANYTGQNDFTADYYNLFGIKMIFVVAAFFLSLYQTFTLKNRISNLDLSPENRKQVPATLKSMQDIGQLVLGVFTIAAFLGVCLARL